MFIAICDDDKAFAEEALLICKECMQDGSEIITFYDGKELLECAEDIDLIILDIEMPNIDGIEVKNEIKRRNDKALIIFVTNHYIFVS